MDVLVKKHFEAKIAIYIQETFWNKKAGYYDCKFPIIVNISDIYLEQDHNMIVEVSRKVPFTPYEFYFKWIETAISFDKIKKYIDLRQQHI